MFIRITYWGPRQTPVSNYKKYQKKKKITRLFKRCETPKHTSNNTFASNGKGNGRNLENPPSIISDCSLMA